MRTAKRKRSDSRKWSAARTPKRTGTGRLTQVRRLSEIPRRLASAAALGMTKRGCACR